MDAKELEKVLADHKEWLLDNTKGKRAYLRRAYLSGADLRRADLSRADLSRADLSGADLSRADLSGADLSRADLSGADLRRADLSGADLSGAKGILSIYPIGSRGDMLVSVIHKDSVMVKTGCFWDTLDNFKKAVKETHGRSDTALEYAACIKLIEVWAEGKQDE